MSQGLLETNRMLDCLNELAEKNINVRHSVTYFLIELSSLYKKSEICANLISSTLHTIFRDRFKSIVFPMKFTV